MRPGRAGSARPAHVLESRPIHIAKDDPRAAVRVLREHRLDLRIDIARHIHQIGPAVVVQIGHSGAPLDVAIQHAETGGERDVLEHAFSEAAIQRGDVVGEVRLEQVQQAVTVEVTDGESHPRLLGAVLAVRDAALDGRVGERPVVVVVVQNRRGRVARDVDVDPPVAVEVGRRCGHGITAGHAGDARHRGHVGERAVAVVVKQEVRIGRQPARAAVDRHTLPDAVGPAADFRRRREIEPEIVRHEQIDTAVAVVVDERAARSPSGSTGRQARAGGDVSEAAVSEVVIEHVLPVVGREQIEAAVVVVVADADARCPADRAETGARRDIGERAIVVVAVEMRRGSPAGRMRLVLARQLLQPRAVQHQRVQPAVVVVVEECDAGPVGFDDETLAVDAAVHRRLAQPGTIRDVVERDGPIGGRSLRSGGGCDRQQEQRGGRRGQQPASGDTPRRDTGNARNTQRVALAAVYAGARSIVVTCASLSRPDHLTSPCRRSAMANSPFASSARPACCSSCARR